MAEVEPDEIRRPQHVGRAFGVHQHRRAGVRAAGGADVVFRHPGVDGTAALKELEGLFGDLLRHQYQPKLQSGRKRIFPAFIRRTTCTAEEDVTQTSQTVFVSAVVLM